MRQQTPACEPLLKEPLKRWAVTAEKKQLGQRGQCHSTPVVYMINTRALIAIPKQHNVLTNSADLASMTAITKIWYQSEWAGLKGELELEPVTNDGA